MQIIHRTFPDWPVSGRKRVRLFNGRTSHERELKSRARSSRRT